MTIDDPTTSLSGDESCAQRGESPRISLDQIIAAAGGVTKLAEIAQVDHSTISGGWRKRGQVSIASAYLISDRLGIPVHVLRPDIFRSPDEVAD